MLVRKNMEIHSDYLVGVLSGGRISEEIRH